MSQYVIMLAHGVEITLILTCLQPH